MATLAFQYGTITKDQLKQVKAAYVLKHNDDPNLKYEDLLLHQKFATHYQIGLLKLIREYMIIKKRGEIFGEIAVDMGFISSDDLKKGLEHQRADFETAKTKKLIGEILVESGALTLKQKDAILKEQRLLEKYASNILSQHPGETKESDDLSDYEKQFLKIKVTDQEFAASALEKGFVTQEEIDEAKTIQENAFQKDHQVTKLDDVMVDNDILIEEQKEIILEEQQKLYPEEELVYSPKIDVIISDDQMEALVKIEKEDMASVLLQDIKDALKNHKVTHGIYNDALLQGNLDMGNLEFVAAKQDFSAELIKSRKATYHFNTKKIDAESIKKGSTLAEQRMVSDNYIKQDLFGDDIEQSKGSDFTFRCAHGVRISKDKSKAFASITGHPSLSIERKLYVHPVLNLMEDADLKYGPLEKYANINIKGGITDAYPIEAGNIRASEIRGATIEAIGDIHVDIGITDAVISCQGSIHARYIHGSKIEAFGNVVVDNEIIDSKISCSGRLASENAAVISSQIFAKKGITLARVGSEKTSACIICAGTENHILEQADKINARIKEISSPLDKMKKLLEDKIHLSKKTFQNMIELKIFHDRAKTTNEKLSKEFQKKKKELSGKKIKNIAKLLNDFEKRMAASVLSLKKLNKIKNDFKIEKENLNKKIKIVSLDTQKKIDAVQLDLFAFFEWARKQENISSIKILKRAVQGTIFKGVFSSTTLKKNLTNFLIFEKQISSDSKINKNGYQMKFKKLV